jgi:hypothetical protein
MFEVGKIGAFTIYDLWYSRGIERFADGRDFKSVLVWTGPDQIYEIATNIRRGSEFPNEELVNLDGEPILVVRSHDGGNNNRIYERLYMFRPTGPGTPDFGPVYEAAEKLTPTNMSSRRAINDYSSMTYTVDTARNDLNLPPVAVQQRGRITVTYHFFDGHAVVIGSNYEPYLQ